MLFGLSRVFSSYQINKKLFFFFFSSRRRHTRSKRDWSSDVCSSDLAAALAAAGRGGGAGGVVAVARPQVVGQLRVRSEERRVGKECRSRWSPDDEKKKKRNKRGVSFRH